MTKIFIGGSRKITRLPQLVIDRIENITNKNLTILIGDANGVDKYVQKYLSDKNYRNVVVFCSVSRNILISSPLCIFCHVVAKASRLYG